MRHYLASIAAAAALACLPLATAAQDRALAFELGLGASVSPAYEGSDEYVTGPTGTAGLSLLRFGALNIEPGDGLGFGISPSFRYLGERDDDDHSRLTGIDDVDAAVELGAQVSYRWPGAEVFGALRMGVTGHDGVVLDLGSDSIFEVAPKTELRFGPRVTFADDAYADTYFDVPTGARLASYDAEGGIHSYGVEMSVRHDFNEAWAMKGTVGWSRLSGSIGDSPVVEDRDSGNLSVVLIRKFDWRW